MDIETKGLGAGSYPEPKEKDYKEISAKINLSFEVSYEVPAEWDKETISDDIKENLHDLIWYNEEIEEVDINAQ